MVEVFVTKAFVGIKLIVLIIIYLFKILFTPFIFLTNLVNDNSHQMDYNEHINSMIDFKFYAHKTLHTLSVSLINIKTAFVLISLQVLAFLLPLREFFHVVIFLVIIDTLTALYALYKEKGSFKDFYNAWTSKRAFDTIKKSIWYSVFGLVLYVIGTGLDEGEIMKKVALGAVGYIEGKSIIENIDKILGTNIWELISSFIKDRFIPKDNQNV